MFQTIQDFLAAFNVSNNQNYYEPVPLSDIKFGFSVKRNYPDNIAFKPILKRNGSPATVAVLWVVLRENIISNDGKILLTVRIAPFNTWKGGFGFDENENDPELPTKESIEASRKTTHPAELEYQNDFYYDTNNNIFVDTKGKTYTGEAILNYAYKEHCDTVHIVKGAELRIKRVIREVCDTILVAKIWILKSILEKIFRYKISQKDGYNLPLSLTMYKFTDIKKEKEEKVGLLGWDAYKETIIIFSVIVTVLSIGSYFRAWKLEYFKFIGDDNFLVVVHTVSALALIETLPLWILFPLLNQIIKLRAKIRFASINPYSYKVWLWPLIFTVLGLILSTSLAYYFTTTFVIVGF